MPFSSGESAAADLGLADTNPLGRFSGRIFVSAAVLFTAAFIDSTPDIFILPFLLSLTEASAVAFHNTAQTQKRQTPKLGNGSPANILQHAEFSSEGFASPSFEEFAFIVDIALFILIGRLHYSI